MQENNRTTPVTFYRLPKVREICGGVAASTIWYWVKTGKFPKPVKLSDNCTAWADYDLDAWAQLRITESQAEK